MSLDSVRIAGRNPSVEWPTVALIGTVYGLCLFLTFFHASLPLWLWLPFAGWTGAWWCSVQHEILHGHPTRNRALNTALGTLPVWLWLPFERYRQTHLAHHRDERLTDPLDDPETRYVTPQAWAALGPLGRALVRAQTTLLGRLTIGPLWSMGTFVTDEARQILGGNARLARIWAWHLVHVALLLVWVLAVCDMPLWQYLLGFSYLGPSASLIRSFAEHKADTNVAKRTAIVENTPLFSLLFLHNNLHLVHHVWPSVAWYRLPRLYREHRAALLEQNGGLRYEGYAEVFRRFLLLPHDRPVHPTGRAPFADGRLPAEPAPPVPGFDASGSLQAGTG